MKYIRTKDGIIESSRVELKGNGRAILHDGNASWQVDSFPIINQADTIEELCDEFVVIFPDETWQTYKLFYVLEDCLKMNYYGGCKYYGAIWTDKGLIYVAKMNDKGELELL